MSSPLFQEAIAQFSLPDGFEVVIEPWPYGGLDNTDENRRFFQGLCFAQDKRSGNPDSNFYSFPLPIIPVMDAHTQQIIRVDRPATGGKGDGLLEQTFKRDIIGHCKPSEYVPELLTEGTRADLKPLNVVQPEGPSFRVTNESLVEWQKWRFRVGFNPREGATIHDLWYDGRSVMHRLAISEMVCSNLWPVSASLRLRRHLYPHTFFLFFELTAPSLTDCTVRRSSSSVPSKAGLRLWRWRWWKHGQQSLSWV
jgi:primary-amine oxidase